MITAKLNLEFSREVENELNKKYTEAAEKLANNYSEENLHAVDTLKERIEAINTIKTTGAHSEMMDFELLK